MTTPDPSVRAIEMMARITDAIDFLLADDMLTFAQVDPVHITLTVAYRQDDYELGQDVTRTETIEVACERVGDEDEDYWRPWRVITE